MRANGRSAITTGRGVFPLDLWVLAGLIAAANVSLLFGRPATWLAFLPSAVRSGEWWRVLTHPFAHVSWYHLVMDAGACLGLYHGLKEYRSSERITATALCAAGSLALALQSATVDAVGLCGLSGAAHGLMALFGLELALGRHRQRGAEWIGALCFLVVLGKSIFEAATGDVLFSSLHLGDVGTPQTLCHLGGVLGGLTAFVLACTRHAGSVSRHRTAAPRMGNAISFGRGVLMAQAEMLQDARNP